MAQHEHRQVDDRLAGVDSGAKMLEKLRRHAFRTFFEQLARHDARIAPCRVSASCGTNTHGDRFGVRSVHENMQ